MAILKVGGTQIASSSGSDVTLDNVALGSGVTGAGSWQLLETITLGTDADVKIGHPSGGSTKLTSTYKIYKIYGVNVTVSGNSAVNARVFLNDVEYTTASPASGYKFRRALRVGSETTDRTSASEGGEIPGACGGGWNDVGSSTTTNIGDQTSFEITFFAPTITSFREPFWFEAWWQDIYGVICYNQTFAALVLAESNAVTAIKLFPAAAGVTFTSGTIKLYGIS